ncbi:MAG: type I pullulanase [Agathobacter sp.]|nr:type I pullulanase [Agathobacter sp.]
MKGKSHKRFGMQILKRVTSAVLVAVMFFTMVGIYIPAETFKAADGVTVTLHFAKPTYMDSSRTNLYVWGVEGGDVAAWPGLNMTANTENSASFTSGGESCNWYTVTIQNYTKKGLNCIVDSYQGSDEKKSYDKLVISDSLTQDYECWITMGGWSESDENGMWKFELITTTDAPTGWVKSEPDNTEYNYTLYVADTIEDKWDDADSKVHTWSVGEGGTDRTLEETNETWKGGKWRKVEFTGKANIGFILAEKSWKWQTENIMHTNTTGADQTIYYVNGTVYTDLASVPDLSVDHYAFIEYGGEAPYGATAFAWGTGYSKIVNGSDWGLFVPFRETADGTYIAKIPVKSNGGEDMKFGFLVNSAPNFDNTTKYSGDLYHTIDGDIGYSKAVFSGGAIVKDSTSIKSSEVHRKNGEIIFHYRDNAVFGKTGVGNLGENASVKVNVIEKTDTAQSQVTSYAMEYDKATSSYTYSLTLKDDTDYYYYYTVNGAEVADNNTTRKVELDGKTYSYNRNKVYNVAVGAELFYSNMDYDQSNLICISYGPATIKDSLDGFKLEHVYLDLSELGLGSRVEVSKDLLTMDDSNNEIRITFGCADTVEPGTKKIKVTLVDDCDGEYVGEANVNVTARNKQANDFDWDEAIIYFAVTDRFYDGNPNNNTVIDDGQQTTAYDKTNPLGIHGGDFAGLTEKLDYLEELGVNTIWITPIVDNIDELVDGNNKSSAYHGYWAEDFETLNPHLGTEEEFVTLLEEVHKRGMKIMVDVVLNHPGYETDDIFNNKLDSGHKDAGGNTVYDDMIRADADVVADDDEKMELSGLPDFMTEDPEVRALLIAWQTSWIQKYEEHIDYFRVDTVKHVDDATWVEFKNEITKINSRFKLIGEYYDAGYLNDYGQLGTGMMDSILDFHFNDILSKVSQENLSEIEKALQERNATLNNVEMMGSFLSSHDEDGFLYTLIQNEKNKNEEWAKNQMKVAVTYQMTAKGQPVIYYGEEIGMTGSSKYPAQANRYDFDWSKATDSNAMLTHYKKMVNIRKEYSEVFAKGDRYSVVIADSQSKVNDALVDINEGYEVFARSYNGETIYVGTNIFGDAKQVTFYVDGVAGSTYTNLYDEKTYTVSENGTITISIPGAANGGTVVLARTAGEATEIVDDNEVTVVIHYNRKDGNYANWNAWLWADTLGGAQYDFEEVNGEMVTEVTVDGRTNTKLNFRIRYGEWKDNDHDGKDQSIDISNIVSGTVHYYIESGVWGGTMVLGSDAIVGNKIVKSSYDRITNTFTITTARPISGAVQSAFDITCTTDKKDITILDVTGNGCVYTVTIEENISSMKEVLKAYTVEFDEYVYNLVMPNIYSTKEFEDAYTYEGKDLGLTYTDVKSTFKVWAPTAEKVVLNVYASGTKGTDDKLGSYEMTLGEKGVWTYELAGDWNGKYYTYSVSVNNETNEVCDPYARTTGVNGNRAMILDLDSTDPDGWADDKNKMPNNGMSYTDAIIYELHVRDLSSDDSSGVSEEHQGKFLGLTETGTRTPGGNLTGLDHIVDLGVTHVHLLPVYDYASVDETKLDEPQFNWGYDPLNYNVPEGSYSTNPYDGASRVSEMKQMVKALHDNNINVIMDVVYNHVYDAGTFGFNQIVPSYFSRTNADGTFSNGSGCGNDTATERSMVHKYVVESILYWHNEYHIDGFRFDLVGLLDTETINTIVEEVHKLDPDIIFYGEGWTLGTAVSKEGYFMATQANASKTPGFAYFSDTLRDNLAGNNTNGQGFIWVNGNVDTMKYAFAGNSSWCPEPTQTINYSSCHDNYTIMDKINEVSNAPYDSYDDAPGAYQVKLNNLSAAYYMFAQGIPFIHAGEEFLRTKLDTDGTVIHNSYNASDYVNTLRWYNLDGTEGDYALYADTVEYYKGLIEFRKNHEALRLTTDAEVNQVLTTYSYENYLLAYKLDGTKVEGEVADEIIIIYNASNQARDVNIKENLGAAGGTYNVCVDVNDAGTDVLRTINADNAWPTVEAHSVLVLVKGETVDNDTVYARNNNVSISLDKIALELKENATATLAATVNPANSTLIWTSSNENVATVDADGNVTAAGVGTATITVSTLHGVSATCTVTVKELTGVGLNKVNLTLKEKESETLVATTKPAGSALTWSSSDETVATVDQTGKVTAIGAGTATITATMANGEKENCEVTILHTLTEVAAKEPTTTATGNIKYYVCDACGKLFLDEEATQPTTLADVTLDKLPTEEPDDPVTPPVEPEDPVVPPVEPEDPVTPPVEPEDPVVPPVEKEDVVYVPEEEIHEQVKDEAGKLTDMIVNDELEEGVVSEETLEKVQQAIENDEEIITELVIENMKDVEVDASAKELVEEAVKDIIENVASTIAQYLDIKVVLKTEESGEELGTLNKLSEEITLTFEIPDEWKKEGRTFHVIRVHEGKTDVLDVWENEDGTVSFKTDRFSTYALVYTDAEVEEDITPTPPVTPEVTPPSTGDNSMPGIYFLVLLAGFAMAIAGMTVSRRKNVK